MEPQTQVASAKDWLEADTGIKIMPYVQNYALTSTVWNRPLPSMDFLAALRRISVPLPAQRRSELEPQLDLEFQAWDTLSDEALMNFEQQLD